MSPLEIRLARCYQGCNIFATGFGVTLRMKVYLTDKDNCRVLRKYKMLGVNVLSAL